MSEQQHSCISIAAAGAGLEVKMLRRCALCTEARDGGSGGVRQTRELLTAAWLGLPAHV